MRFLSRSFAAVALALCAAALFSGCSHYQLGTGGTLPFRTLYIAPVENTANIPEAAAVFSTQIRDRFIRDGRVTLASSPGEADAVLTINLERYTRNMTTARGDDTGLARKFDLTVFAVCTLTDNRGGKTYFEKRPVTATRQIFTTPAPGAQQSDQLQAEYNTLPLLASSLAENAAHAVLDTW